MPRVNLTDAFCRSAKPLDDALTEYADMKERGLSLRVTPAGVKSWTFRYRTLAGQQKRVSLGRLDDLSLAKARAAAGAERVRIHEGGDLAAVRKAAKSKAIASAKLETVEEIGRRYMKEAEAGRHRPNARKKRASSLASDTYYLEKHVLPAFGAERLADLTRARIQAFVNDLADKFAPSAAIQSLKVMQGIFVFAARQELVAVNPCQFVTVPRFEARERVLTDEELRTIWQTLDHASYMKGMHVGRVVVLAVMLATVTCQRRGEVSGTQKSEIDLDAGIWTLPSTRTKNHRTHVVPLSGLALRIAREAWDLSGDSPFLFPSAKDKSKATMPVTLTHAMNRALPVTEVGKTGRSKADEKQPVENARLHDLRRTGATNMTGERIGIPRFIVSKVLNHSSDTGDSAAVTAVYDRNAYLTEKRRALDAWAALLLEIVEERKRPANVFTLAR